MKGRGSRGVRGVRRSRRGGRRGGYGYEFHQIANVLGGGKRPFIKRTCRSKSRCGGAANYGQVPVIGLGGSRGVGRSRRGGRVGGRYNAESFQLNSNDRMISLRIG